MRHSIAFALALAALSCHAEDPQVGDGGWKIFQAEARSGDDVARANADFNRLTAKLFCQTLSI
jgi:hypothetical protein